MKRNYILLTSLFMLFALQNYAQTIWDGPTITVTKESDADWTLEENQDRITDNVWLTRADTRGFFNIVLEDEFDNVNNTSPLDTEWAVGTTADIDDLTFLPWTDYVNNAPMSTINVASVLHLITDDIYIDYTLIAFQGGGPGGAFTYERSSDPALSISDVQDTSFSMYPNPTTSSITFPELTKEMSYEIFNVLGAQVATGTVQRNVPVSVSQLKNGIYFIRLDGSTTQKLIKR